MSRDEIVHALARVPDRLKVTGLAHSSDRSFPFASNDLIFVYFVEDIDEPTSAEQVSANS